MEKSEPDVWKRGKETEKNTIRHRRGQHRAGKQDDRDDEEHPQQNPEKHAVGVNEPGFPGDVRLPVFADGSQVQMQHRLRFHQLHSGLHDQRLL